MRTPFQVCTLQVILLVLWACFVTLLNAGEDFYALLGVDKGASVKEIRRAFKKLAISKHPDKNVVSELSGFEFEQTVFFLISLSLAFLTE